jgi:hypothetical protein
MTHCTATSSLPLPLRSLRNSVRGSGVVWDGFGGPGRYGSGGEETRYGLPLYNLSPTPTESPWEFRPLELVQIDQGYYHLRAGSCAHKLQMCKYQFY